jgi:hypothetical protein
LEYLFRDAIAERRVRTALVVVLAPGFDDFPCFNQIANTRDDLFKKDVCGFRRFWLA